MSDIGEKKIYISVIINSLGDLLISNIKIDNKVLYIVFIDNIVMDIIK